MTAWLVRIFLRLCALFPLPAAHALGAGLGKVASRLPSRYREYTFYNLRICFPEFSDAERHDLLRRSFAEDGKCLLELGALWYRRRSWVLQRIQSTTGLEHLEAAQRHGRGVIIAGPHVGAWELLGLYVSTLVELDTLYRPPRDLSFENLLVSRRGRFGGRQVAAGSRGVRQIAKALRRNACVGVLPDQQPLQGQGVFAPFFHSPALTMTLLPRLAQRSGAPVVFAYAERLPAGRGYAIHFQAPWLVSPDASMEQAATELNRRVEACARAVPAQYMWGYKRFSERPPGVAQAYPKNRKLARREAREKRKEQIARRRKSE